MIDHALLNALRAAVAAAPDQPALRRHLAELLLEAGEFKEAEQNFRKCLDQAPGDLELRLGLAEAYTRQEKFDVAIFILEELLRTQDAPGRAYRLAARAYLGSGDNDQARQAYQKAVEADPSLADAELADRLGAGSIHTPPGGRQAAAAGAGQTDSGEQREKVPVYSQPPPPASGAEIEKPRLTFKDVGGMEKLKDEIRLKIIHPLEKPEIYQAYGKAVGGGILMYGPPGCGKTHLARATAGEVKAHFLSVGIQDVLNMYLGESESNLHEVFELARANTPCVLFFDEVDALGASRADMRQSAGRHLINQFLAEMDGIASDNEGVLVLAATNAPWHLDPALRRPGRFDRVLFVPPPDFEARAVILRIHLAGKPVDAIDYERLARETDGFSGADLKGVVDQAVESKLGEAMRRGSPLPIGSKDLLAIVKATHPTTREWFSTARNYALFANQSGLYDEILNYLDPSERPGRLPKKLFGR